MAKENRRVGPPQEKRERPQERDLRREIFKGVELGKRRSPTTGQQEQTKRGSEKGSGKTKSKPELPATSESQIHETVECWRRFGSDQ